MKPSSSQSNDLKQCFEIQSHVKCLFIVLFLRRCISLCSESQVFASHIHVTSDMLSSCLFCFILHFASFSNLVVQSHLFCMIVSVVQEKRVF